MQRRAHTKEAILESNDTIYLGTMEEEEEEEEERKKKKGETHKRQKAKRRPILENSGPFTKILKTNQAS